MEQKMLVLFITYLWTGISGGQGADHNCVLEYKKGCVSKVISNFEEKIIKQEKEFTVYYKIPQKEEPIAECDWAQSGNLECLSSKGFTCDKNLTKNFSILVDYETRCLQLGEFNFDVKNADVIRCEVSSYVTQDGNFNDGPTDLKDKEANSEGPGIVTGVICSCLVVVVVVAAVILVFFLRKRNRGTNASPSNDGRNESSEIKLLNANRRQEQDTLLEIQKETI